MAAPADLTIPQRDAWNNVAHISSFWGRQVGPPPFTSNGMENPAWVTCYQISVIQCLLHAPKFVNWLEQHHVDEQDNVVCEIPECIACSLRSLSMEYWQPHKDQTAIRQQVESYRHKHRLAGWRRDGQQDAHELYASLMNHIIEQCISDYTLLQALFGLERTYINTCPSCGEESRNSAIDRHLSCPFSRPGTLIDIISTDALGPEVLESRCTNALCEDHPLRQRRHIIDIPPEILVVHLVRFRYDPITNIPKKKKDVISIPEQLDISTFCEGTGSFNYRLFAVIKHAGSLDFGHYIVHTKGPSEQWEQINDSEVTSSTINDAISSNGPFIPYIIFYQKVYGDSEAGVDPSHSSLRSSISERSLEKPSNPTTSHLLIASQIRQWLAESTPEPEPKLSSESTTSSELSTPQYSPESLIPKFLSQSPTFMPLIAKHALELISSSPTNLQHTPNLSSLNSLSPQNGPDSPLAKYSTIQPPPSKTPSPINPLGSSPPPAPRPTRRVKRTPKYLIPENPSRVQPRRTCRGSEIERPVRVQPRRVCCKKGKRNGIEEKAKVKKRKDEKRGNNKRGSGRRGRKR